ncbi:MAG: cytochrome c oxidase subunit II [Pseudomonadota bacterium]|nr:cytochrome c oxidase subunit II [Pseudomonadota bacterium]MEC8664950.1 cytochrome c oxidase subunit II [Pseudomonadota bacterium]
MLYKPVTSATIKMNRLFNLVFGAILVAGLVLISQHSFANMGMEPWGIDLQHSASPIKDRIHDFHTLLLWVISAIVALVMVLMLVIMVRFNAKANPTPSKTTHNFLLEVIWTALPVVILIAIAIPSIQLLYYEDRTIDADMTIKVEGRQWYWNYTYLSDEEGEDLQFDAYLIPEKDIDTSKGQMRLLSTDNQLVLPIDTDIEILVTAGAEDVLHSYAMPAFGIKMDAVPGRMNHTWVRISKEGRYYGQCSELCGQGHAYMPSEVVAVSKEEYAAWLDAAKNGTVAYDEFKAGYDLANAQ